MTLKLTQGEVAGIEVEFVNKEGETSDENGNPIGGKTKDWVVTREISICRVIPSIAPSWSRTSNASTAPSCSVTSRCPPSCS